MTNFLIRLRSENGQIKDLANNPWKNSGVTATSDGLYFNGSSYLDFEVSSSIAKVIKSGSNFTYSAWYYQEESSQYSAAIFQIIDILLLFIKNPENNGYGGIATTTQWKIYNISENLNQYGKWTHIAIVRYNNIITLYLNGRSIGLATDWMAGDIKVTRCAIGYLYHSSSNSKFKGWVQDLFFLNDKALWTSNFTPPPIFYALNNTLWNFKNNMYGYKNLKYVKS